MSGIIDIRALTLCAGEKRILNDVSFSIAPGECFALVGASGSGKSMTSLAIMRLLPRGVSVRSGEVTLDGMPLGRQSEAEMCKIRGKRIAMIFQEPMNALDPVKRVGEQVEEALRLHFRLSASEAKRRVYALFEEVGLSPAKRFYARYPHQLSGGQKQRVVIAIALACEPEVLIADEPTTALDVTVQAQILALLQTLRRERRLAMLFVSHDLAVVAQVADRIGVLKEGTLVETATASKFFAAPSHPYSAALLRYVRTQAKAERREKEAHVVLETRRLCVVYERKKEWFSKERTVAVRDVSFAIRKGETLALVGESGSGKSTVAKAIVSLVPIRSGEIRLEGMPLERVRDYRKKVQMVFQDPYGSLNPRMRVYEIIREAMDALGVKVADTRAHIEGVLRDVELDVDALDRYPHAFSGGQRQRIAIARALAVGPEVLVLDEPTSALDVIVRAEIVALLKRLQRRKGIAYLFITHDIALVASVAHRVAVMRRGEIVEYGDAERVLRAPQHDYTKTLLQSAPKLPETDESV